MPSGTCDMLAFAVLNNRELTSMGIENLTWGFQRTHAAMIRIKTLTTHSLEVFKPRVVKSSWALQASAA
eukprot:6214709-Pleurochrysis_carterae.AAC.2